MGRTGSLITIVPGKLKKKQRPTNRHIAIMEIKCRCMLLRKRGIGVNNATPAHPTCDFWQMKINSIVVRIQH